MMKIVITGVSGFVGDYLIKHILTEEPDVQILGLDAVAPRWKYGAAVACRQVDLLDRDRTEGLLRDIKPDCIIHLASFSSVADSWKDPIRSFKNNTNIFLNLLEIVHALQLQCRILSIGSSEEYGIVKDGDLPLRESMSLNPVSPYAVARVAQEQLSAIYAKGFSMDIVCTRSFNHIGPGQPDKFVVSSIGKQFAEIKRGLRETLYIGSTGIIRDFLDVRDVVRAYYLLVKKGARGEVYNICSGRGISIGELIDMFSETSGISPAAEVRAELQRPVENPKIIGSYEKINAHVGWQPEITLRESIKDIYEYWLSATAATGEQQK